MLKNKLVILATSLLFIASGLAGCADDDHKDGKKGHESTDTGHDHAHEKDHNHDHDHENNEDPNEHICHHGKETSTDLQADNGIFTLKAPHVLYELPLTVENSTTTFNVAIQYKGEKARSAAPKQDKHTVTFVMFGKDITVTEKTLTVTQDTNTFKTEEAVSNPKCEASHYTFEVKTAGTYKLTVQGQVAKDVKTVKVLYEVH